MHKARKEMIEAICKTWDLLEGGTNMNSTSFINYTKDMSDDEFFKYIHDLLADQKRHLYFEIELFETEPRFEEVEAAADYLGVKLFDYLFVPHLSDDPNNPICTIHKIFIGFINMRRVQQLVNKKNNIPTDIDQRNPKTGQVTSKSKAARVSDVELFALICHGTNNILKEYFGPKGGDPVMEQEMLHQIATNGYASLEELPNRRVNKVALNTANVVLLGAAMESNLVTEGGILPRTLEKQYEGARGLSREKSTQ